MQHDRPAPALQPGGLNDARVAKRRRHDASGQTPLSGVTARTPQETQHNNNIIYTNDHDGGDGRHFLCEAALSWSTFSPSPSPTRQHPQPIRLSHPFDSRTNEQQCSGLDRTHADPSHLGPTAPHVPQPPSYAAPTYDQVNPRAPAPTSDATRTVQQATMQQHERLPMAAMPYIGDYRGATWNTQALLARDPGSPNAKSKLAAKLHNEHDFTGLQETHGTPGAAAAAKTTERLCGLLVAWICAAGGREPMVQTRLPHKLQSGQQRFLAGACTRKGWQTSATWLKRLTGYLRYLLQCWGRSGR